MTFSTSLIAHSICALASLPETAAHGGAEVAYTNLFAAFGGKVMVEERMTKMPGTSRWRADLIVDFGDFNVIVEVASHKSAGTGRFAPNAWIREHTYLKNTKKYGVRSYTFRRDAHESKVKQALAYASVANFNKPTVCFVASNKEFVAFNPNTFKISTLVNLIRKSGISPACNDVGANVWVARQKAFKLLQKQEVPTIGKCNPDTFVRYLRALAMGEIINAPRAIAAVAG